MSEVESNLSSNEEVKVSGDQIHHSSSSSSDAMHLDGQPFTISIDDIDTAWPFFADDGDTIKASSLVDLILHIEAQRHMPEYSILDLKGLNDLQYDLGYYNHLQMSKTDVLHAIHLLQSNGIQPGGLFKGQGRESQRMSESNRVTSNPSLPSDDYNTNNGLQDPAPEAPLGHSTPARPIEGDLNSSFFLNDTMYTSNHNDRDRSISDSPAPCSEMDLIRHLEEESSSAIEAAETRSAHFFEQLSQEKELHHSSREQLRLLNAENVRIKHDLDTLKGAYDEAVAQLNELNLAKDTLGRKYSEALSRIEQLQEDKDKLRSRFFGARRESINGHIAKESNLQEENAAAAKQVSEKLQELIKQHELLSQEKEKFEIGATEQIKSREERNRHLEEECAELRDENLQLNHELDKLKAASVSNNEKTLQDELEKDEARREQIQVAQTTVGLVEKFLGQMRQSNAGSRAKLEKQLRAEIEAEVLLKYEKYIPNQDKSSTNANQRQFNNYPFPIGSILLILQTIVTGMLNSLQDIWGPVYIRGVQQDWPLVKRISGYLSSSRIFTCFVFAYTVCCVICGFGLSWAVSIIANASATGDGGWWMMNSAVSPPSSLAQGAYYYDYSSPSSIGGCSLFSWLGLALDDWSGYNGPTPS